MLSHPQVKCKYGATIGGNEMISANFNLSMNGNVFVSLTSTSQILNPASKVDLVYISAQNPALLPRVPGTGKEYVVQVAPDFNDTLEMGI